MSSWDELIIVEVFFDPLLIMRRPSINLEMASERRDSKTAASRREFLLL